MQQQKSSEDTIKELENNLNGMKIKWADSLISLENENKNSQRLSEVINKITKIISLQPDEQGQISFDDIYENIINLVDNQLESTDKPTDKPKNKRKK